MNLDDLFGGQAFDIAIFIVYSIANTRFLLINIHITGTVTRSRYCYGYDLMKLSLHQYKAGTGWDIDPDSSLDSPQTLLLFFASPVVADVADALQSLESVFRQSVMFGCSSAGEIYNDEINDHSISLAIVKLEHTPIRLAVDELSGTNPSIAAGANLAKQLQQDDLRAVMLLSDGLMVNGSQLINSLSKNLSEDIVITGGLAGDSDRFEKTWVWADGAMKPGHVCAVGFYGDRVGVGHGSRGGWDMLGPEREVTRSDANVLYELDGQHALDLYKKYLGDRADGLPATGLLFPLAIRNEEEADGNTVRTILAVNEDDHSITFAGDIPQGSYVRLMRANFDRLIDGAADASTDIDTASYSMGPILNVAISCVGRRLVLGPRTEEEIEAALDGLPEGTRQIGYYSYGEISPLASGRCDLHNQTMTLTTIWENQPGE